MASRKQQKEEARQRRLEQERALATQAQRRRRMQMLGGVLVAAIAVVAVAVAISAGSTGTGGLKHGKAATQTFNQVNALFKGIPQSGTTLGNPNAKVTMYYYGDLECPVCRAFTVGDYSGGFPQLVRSDVRLGKVKVVYKSYCTATCNNHPRSVFNEQQVAAYAAGKQHLFWDYADLFYREQESETTSYVTPSFLSTLAQQIPTLKLSSWQADQKDPSLLSQVQADEQQASRLGLSGTPSLVAQGPKGLSEAFGSIPTYASLEQAIRKVS